jgi:hypothetical protein
MEVPTAEIEVSTSEVETAEPNAKTAVASHSDHNAKIHFAQRIASS